MVTSAILMLCLTRKPTGFATGMDGKRHEPLREARGRASAFIFINHDCPICNAYTPEINRLVTKYGAKVKIQLVYSEPNFTVSAARAHAKEFSLVPMTAWIDDGRTFAARCAATIVPEAVLYDAAGDRVWAGRIDDQYVSLGVRQQAVSHHDLRDALDMLIHGKRPTPSTGKPVGCYILSPGTL